VGWLSGKKPGGAPEGKTLAKEIGNGVGIINKGNVDTYMQDMKKEFGK